MADPTNSELARQMAALEERMNTKQAEYKTDIAELAGRTDAAIERLRADIARETSALGWRIILFTIAIVGLATAVLGILIGLPGGGSA